MIRHTVLFNIKPTVSKSEIAYIFREILELQNKLPGILSVVIDECDFHEATEIRPFSHGFSIDFKDEYSLNCFFHDSVTYPIKDRIYECYNRRLSRYNWL